MEKKEMLFTLKLLITKLKRNRFSVYSSDLLGKRLIYQNDLEKSIDENILLLDKVISSLGLNLIIFELYDNKTINYEFILIFKTDN
jgi:hypothetical protein